MTHVYSLLGRGGSLTFFLPIHTRSFLSAADGKGAIAPAAEQGPMARVHDHLV